MLTLLTKNEVITKENSDAILHLVNDEEIKLKYKEIVDWLREKIYEQISTAVDVYRRSGNQLTNMVITFEEIRSVECPTEDLLDEDNMYIFGHLKACWAENDTVGIDILTSFPSLLDDHVPEICIITDESCYTTEYINDTLCLVYDIARISTRIEEGKMDINLDVIEPVKEEPWDRPWLNEEQQDKVKLAIELAKKHQNSMKLPGVLAVDTRNGAHINSIEINGYTITVDGVRVLFDWNNPEDGLFDWTIIDGTKDDVIAKFSNIKYYKEMT